MRYEDRILAEMIKGSIGASLKDTLQMVTINAKQSKAKISGPLNKLVKDLQVLQQDADNIDKYIKSLQEIVSNSKTIEVKADGDNNTKVLEKIEDQLGILQRTYKDLKQAKSIADRVEMQWGNNKSVASFLKEAKATVKRFEDLYTKALEVLTELSKEKRPSILNIQKNNELKSLFNWITSEFNKTYEQNELKEKPVLEVNNSTFLVDMIKDKDIIRFARYVPMKNLPLSGSKSGNKTTDLYLTIIVDMYSPTQNKKGKLEATKMSPLYLTVSKEIVPPNKAPKMYKISNVMKDAKNVLEYFAQRFSLLVFGTKISGSSESRREKIGNKLYILNNKKIKMDIDGQFLHVEIPKSVVDELQENEYDYTETGMSNKLPKVFLPKATKLTNKTRVELYIDVKRILGLPQSGDVARYTTDRLKEEEIKEKNGNISITYRLLQMKPTQDLVSPLNVKEDKILEQDENDTDFINQLRKQAKMFLDE